MFRQPCLRVAVETTFLSETWCNLLSTLSVDGENVESK